MELEPDYCRILLVEDDAELASMMADSLASDGFYVSIEQRGDSAVERITAENPDAVVLDISRLSGLDGCAACEAVRASYHGVIILLTAGDGEVDDVVGLEAGGAGHSHLAGFPLPQPLPTTLPIWVGL
jgi:DNA-binding response OmpR family regulator